jgi:hypothetical protein
MDEDEVRALIAVDWYRVHRGDVPEYASSLAEWIYRLDQSDQVLVKKLVYRLVKLTA